MDDAGAEAALASGASGATAWIPESAVWAQRLSYDLANAASPASVEVRGSVASSPIVMVVPAGRRRPDVTLTSLTTAGVGGRPAFSLPDPTASAEGVLGLHLLRATAGTSPPSTRVLAGLMVALGTGEIDSTKAGFARIGGVSAAPFIASEQAVAAFDAASGSRTADALYLPGPVPALDYPAVHLVRPGTDPLVTSVATSFLRVLAGVTAQRVLATHGFRNPRGDPIAGATGTGAGMLRLLPPPTSAETQDLLRMWSAATAASHSLAVIDVSGSMAELTADGHTKIELAADAVSRAVAYFPDSSSFGLWAFSSGRGRTPAWTQLVALRPLGAPDHGTTQRIRLMAAARGCRPSSAATPRSTPPSWPRSSRSATPTKRAW